MKTKQLGFFSFLLAFLTLAWVVLLIWGMASAGPLETFEQVLAYAARGGALFTLTYANATLLTLIASMLFAGLYRYCREASPLWATVGLVFVPVYCLLNLLAYFSQITVVPRLVELSHVAGQQEMAEFALRQVIQQWPDSAASIFNNLAYAILGIPSILYGAILYRMRRSLRLGAILLALNGVACIAGVIGVSLRSSPLSLGSVVGGVLFLAALVALGWVFNREEKLALS